MTRTAFLKRAFLRLIAAAQLLAHWLAWQQTAVTGGVHAALLRLRMA
ncbi:hypothetical protein [Tepidimonas sediminis]|nr:hypothetical protein [Tepidimonas sediminis]